MEGPAAALILVAVIAAAVIVGHTLISIANNLSQRPILNVVPTPYLAGGTKLVFVVENKGTAPAELTEVTAEYSSDTATCSCEVSTLNPNRKTTCTCTFTNAIPENVSQVAVKTKHGTLIVTFVRV